jgi:hypothetical protein
MQILKKRPVCNSDLNCIDRGMRGELVAALLIIRARDVSSVTSRSVYVKALLPDDEYKKLRLQNFPPLHSQHLNETRIFEEIFKGPTMWFNHVIRIRNTDMINVQSLLQFITRGTLICGNNQHGADTVLPISDPSRSFHLVM